LETREVELEAQEVELETREVFGKTWKVTFMAWKVDPETFPKTFMTFWTAAEGGGSGRAAGGIEGGPREGVHRAAGTAAR
jgi:hypothetical protein